MMCFEDSDVQWQKCETADVGNCRCNAMLAFFMGRWWRDDDNDNVSEMLAHI